MALTDYNEPVFKPGRIETEVVIEEVEVEEEVAIVIAIVGGFLFLGCIGYIASRWMANVGNARKNNMMRRMRVSQDDMMDGNMN